MRFTTRRIRNILLSIAITISLLILLRIYGTPLYRMQIWSGWILFTLIIFLLLYNLRKKLPMLPLGKAAWWLQCHSYMGLITVVMFMQHINFRFPTGIFEILFASIFITTACTGIIGLILCRVIPRYLSKRGEEVIFERIPILTAELRQRTQSLVKDCSTSTKSSVIFEYYQFHLADYFYEPKNVLYHLYGSTTPWHAMFNKHQTFCRFLNTEEKQYADQLLTLMRQKDELDFHYALQGLLKAWTFLHLPLSFALLICTLLHLTLVYAFIGGI